MLSPIATGTGSPAPPRVRHDTPYSPLSAALKSAIASKRSPLRFRVHSNVSPTSIWAPVSLVTVHCGSGAPVPTGVPESRTLR